MKRNPDALCGNCPYYDTTGYCRRVPSCESKHGLSWCGEHPDFAAPEPSDMPEPDDGACVSVPKGTGAPDGKVVVKTLYGTHTFDWNFEAIIANLSELVALRHETRDCASFPSRKAVRAELRGYVCQLQVYKNDLVSELVNRDSVLALLED